SRRGNRHRQSAQQVPALKDDFLARRAIHDNRVDGVGDRAHPCGADFLDRTSHADAIDPRRSGERADYNWNVIAPPAGVDDIGEEKGTAFIPANPAEELAAYQGVQFGVFIDRFVDANQEAIRVELGQVRLKIEARVQMFKILSALA